MTLTPARLAEIRARLAAATPGPWAYGDTGMWSNDPDLPDDPDNYSFGAATVIDSCPECEMSNNIPSEANREFIARAPTDIALLLAEVDRLRDGPVEDLFRRTADVHVTACSQCGGSGIEALLDGTPEPTTKEKL